MERWRTRINARPSAGRPLLNQSDMRRDEHRGTILRTSARISLCACSRCWRSSGMVGITLPQIEQRVRPWCSRMWLVSDCGREYWRPHTRHWYAPPDAGESNDDVEKGTHEAVSSGDNMEPTVPIARSSSPWSSSSCVSLYRAATHAHTEDTGIHVSVDKTTRHICLQTYWTTLATCHWFARKTKWRSVGSFVVELERDLQFWYTNFLSPDKLVYSQLQACFNMFP